MSILKGILVVLVLLLLLHGDLMHCWSLCVASVVRVGILLHRVTAESRRNGTRRRSKMQALPSLPMVGHRFDFI
jgi:hypothetical protein